MNVARWERFWSRLGFSITVDYRQRGPRGGTWPGGRATLQGNLPRGVRTRKKADDARYIYISYMLLAELHLFEQVNNLGNDFQPNFISFLYGKKKEQRKKRKDKETSDNKVYERSKEKVF